MTDVVSGTIVLVVGIISLGLATMGALAARNSSDNRLWFVTAAFAVFGFKGVLTATALWTENIGHESLEMIGAIMDLAAVSLLVVPFLKK